MQIMRIFIELDIQIEIRIGYYFFSFYGKMERMEPFMEFW